MSRPFNTESVFRAIAHPGRRRVLELLAKRELRPTDMTLALGGTRPSVSQHLAVLRHSGLVVVRRQSNTLVYRLNHEAVTAVGHGLGA